MDEAKVLKDELLPTCTYQARDLLEVVLFKKLNFSVSL